MSLSCHINTFHIKGWGRSWSQRPRPCEGHPPPFLSRLFEKSFNWSACLYSLPNPTAWALYFQHRSDYSTALLGIPYWLPLSDGLNPHSLQQSKAVNVQAQTCLSILNSYHFQTSTALSTPQNFSYIFKYSTSIHTCWNSHLLFWLPTMPPPSSSSPLLSYEFLCFLYPL